MASFNSSSADLCQECSSSERERHCNICGTEICVPCFQKIHSAKTMKHHTFEKIISKYSISLLECSDHNKECTYVCCTCSNDDQGFIKVICSVCHFAGDHSLHKYINLADWNKSHAGELFQLRDELQDKATKLQLDTTMCKKLLQEMKTSSVSLQKNINDIFIRIHGQLQMLQSDIFDQLQETTNKNASSLKNMIGKVENGFHEADKFLGSLNSVSESNLDSVNIISVMENAKSFISAVPNLVIEDSDIGEWGRVKFVVEPDLISEFIVLELLEVSNFLTLEKKEEVELPEVEIPFKETEAELLTKQDVKIEEVEESANISFNKTPKRHFLRRPHITLGPRNKRLKDEERSKVDSCDRNTGETLSSPLTKMLKFSPHALRGNSLLKALPAVMSTRKKYEDIAGEDFMCSDDVKKEESEEEEEESSPSSAKKELFDLCKTKENAVNTIHYEEDVVVTEIERTLETFYIQRKCDKENIELMSALVNGAVQDAQSPANIEEGTIYLAQFSKDQCWYRCVYVSEINDLFVVKFIDYGNIDQIPIESIKSCPDYLNTTKFPPYAYPCALWGIEPMSNEGYSEEAVLTFVELVTFQQQIQFFVYSIDSSHESGNQLRPKYSVDLRCSCNLQSVSDDLPVSVRECFIFLEFGRSTLTIEEDTTTVNSRDMFWRRNYYKPSVPLNPSASVQVKVTRIDSPTSFYIQICSSQASLKIVIGEMKAHYSSESVSKQLCWKIFSPKIGMLCAVKSNSDNLWLRARIDELRSGSNALVTYVDTGIEEEVHYTRLRKMPDRFLNVPAQAIRCKLMNVVYLSDEVGWHESAIHAFKEMVLENETLLAAFYKKCDDLFEISLAINHYNTEIDVARNLIDADLAIPNDEKLNLGLKKMRALQCVMPEFSQNKFSLGTRRAIKKLNPMKKMSEILIAPMDSSMKPGKACSAGLLSICHLVDITEVNSPSHIHARRYSEREKYNDFQIELYNKMSSASYVADEDFRPCVGRTCVAKFGHKSPFFARVRLLEQNGSVFKALLIDCGGIQDIEESNLVPIPKGINNGKPFCTVVSLASISPPCGKKNWPTSTVDALKTTLKSRADIYMIKKGQCHRKPDLWNLKVLPVELGWMQEISGGPFDADDYIFISVQDVLLNEGLVLPIRASEQFMHQSETSSAETVMSMSACDSRHSLEGVSEAPYHSNFLSPSPEICVGNEMNDLPVLSSPETNKPPNEILPPQLPLAENFKALVTNVDMEGNICLHTLESNHTLSLMVKSHNFAVGRKEFSDADMSWKIGDFVVAKYHLDKSWYRAQILRWDKKESDVHVEFVDYGNRETVNLQDIRTNMPFSNIPIQCYKCTLGIIPAKENKWTENTLDFLHEMVVMKQFDVTILEQKKGCLPRIEMKQLDKDEMNMADFFVNKIKVCKYGRFAEETDEDEAVSEDENSSDIIIESDESDEELLDVLELVCPTDPSELVVVKVVSIIDPAFCFISPQGDLVDPVSVGKFWKQTNKVLTAMKELQNYIKRNCGRYNLEGSPKVGGVYLVRFTEYGDHFFRVKVWKINDEKINFKFIDYGNDDEVETDADTNTFYIIPDKFRNIPSLAVKVQLQGVCSPGRKPWSEEAMNEMIQCLINTDQRIYASFNGNGETPKVTLFFKDGDGRKILCYKSLYDSNLITLV